MWHTLIFGNKQKMTIYYYFLLYITWLKLCKLGQFKDELAVCGLGVQTLHQFYFSFLWTNFINIQCILGANFKENEIFELVVAIWLWYHFILVNIARYNSYTTLISITLNWLLLLCDLFCKKIFPHQETSSSDVKGQHILRLSYSKVKIHHSTERVHV